MDYDTTYFATLLSIAYSVITDVLSWFGIGSSISGGETSSCPYEVLGLQNVKDTCTIDDVNKARRKVSMVYILNVCMYYLCVHTGSPLDLYWCTWCT